MLNKISITALISAYFLICGSSYLWAYWYNFPINIKTIASLITPLDILKSFTTPLVSYAGAVLLYTLPALIDDDLWFTHKKSRLPFGVIFVSLATLVIWLILIYKSFGNEKTLYSIGLSSLLMIPYVICLSVFKLPSILPNIQPSRRFFLLALILYVPFFSALIGLNDGKNIKYTIGNLVMIDSKPCSQDPNEKFILVAIYGDKGLSMSSKDGSICLFVASQSNYRTGLNYFTEGKQ